MGKKKTLLLLVVLFAGLLAGAGILYRNLGSEALPEQLATQPPESAVQTTEPEETLPQETEAPLAPDFTVYDREGNPVRLQDYFGKPIVLNFWASWCGPCKMEMPDFNEKYLELKGEVHFLMINMTDGSRETVETASDFIAEQGYVFPVFFDTTYDAARTYGAYSLPTTFFIDGEGHPIAQATGAIDAATLQRGIDMIYKP